MASQQSRWTDLPEVVPSEYYNNGPQLQYSNDKEQWKQYTGGHSLAVDAGYGAVAGQTPPPPFHQQPADNIYHPPGPWWKRRKVIFWISGIVFLVAAVVAIVVGVLVSQRQGGSGDQDRSSQSTPSSTPTSSGGSAEPSGSSSVHTFGRPTSLPANLPPSSCQQAMCPDMLASASFGTSPSRFLFSRGADGAIWYRKADAEGWKNEWESLGGSFISPPTALSIRSGQIDVFGIWDNQELRVKTLRAGAWDSEWLNLSGSCVSQPTTTSFGSDRLSLLCVKPDRQMQLKYYRPHQWGPSTTGWQDLGGWLAGVPALDSGAEELVNIVGYGFQNWTIGDETESPSYSMMYNRFNTTHWVGWEGAWGTFKGDPALIAVTATQSEHFGVSTDGALWHNSWLPSRTSRPTDTHGIVDNLDLSNLSLQFTIPQNLGGNFTSTPVAWATGLTRIDVVAVGDDSRLKHKARIDGTWADDWEDLGGWFDSAPLVWAPTNLKDENVYIFGLGPDGAVIHGLFSMGEGHEFGSGTWFTDEGEMTATPYRIGAA